MSQVLNQTLDTTFFDYVNRCRIEASLPRILAGDATVLTIALDVGFNARSTFYTAFQSRDRPEPEPVARQSGARRRTGLVLRQPGQRDLKRVFAVSRNIRLDAFRFPALATCADQTCGRPGRRS